MKNQNHSFAEKLIGQESMDSGLRTDYQKRIADMMDRKIHWLPRGIFGLIALGGIVYSVSLVWELFEPLESEVNFIIKGSIFFLLACVVFYTSWIAITAIRGKSRIGSTPSIISGVVIVTGFFAFLWSFLIFVLPRLMQLLHEKSDYPFVGDMWVIGTVCMLLIIGFFGVLTAGIVFMLHLLCKYHSRNHRKLLEIELALADLSEKKADSVSSV